MFFYIVMNYILKCYDYIIIVYIILMAPVCLLVISSLVILLLSTNNNNTTTLVDSILEVKLGVQLCNRLTTQRFLVSSSPFCTVSAYPCRLWDVKLRCLMNCVVLYTEAAGSLTDLTANHVSPFLFPFLYLLRQNGFNRLIIINMSLSKVFCTCSGYWVLDSLVHLSAVVIIYAVFQLC